MKQTTRDTNAARNVNKASNEDWFTTVHFVVWALLLLGLWLRWKAAMLIGMFLAVTNMATQYVPIGVTTLMLLVLLPFQPKTGAGVNLCLFLMMGLVVQVWQVFFWIEGAAAN